MKRMQSWPRLSGTGLDLGIFESKSKFFGIGQVRRNLEQEHAERFDSVTVDSG